MKNIWILILCFIAVNQIIGQQPSSFTQVTTARGVVKIPGHWQQISATSEAEPIYLKNDRNVILTVEKNPRGAYPFITDGLSNSEVLDEYYNWMADWRLRSNMLTSRLTEYPEQEYVVWKCFDGRDENVYLFGLAERSFINLSASSRNWGDLQKKEFLEQVYQLNR